MKKARPFYEASYKLEVAKMVGLALTSQMRASVVCSALNMAIIAKQPALGVVVHTDQGSHNQ